MANNSFENITRPHYTDLQPLTTGQASQGRRVSSTSPYGQSITHSTGTPDSAFSLASPTLVAVREYYRDNGLSTAFQATPTARRSSASLLQDFPRRHSSITSRFSRLNVSSPLGTSATPKKAPVFASIAEESRKQLLDGVNGGELARLRSVVARRQDVIRADVITQASGKVPFQYTYERLRQWGHAYLGNAGTADVFVRAVHLRKTQGSTQGDSEPFDNGRVVDQGKSNDNITVRARVTPRAKERKPFLLQRSFNVEELRTSVSSKNSVVVVESSETSATDGESSSKGLLDEQGAEECDFTVTHPRSNSTPTLQPTACTPIIKATPTDKKCSKPAVSPQRRVMPIHIEYALHYLPILAALMLCGHVRKGDLIDLPIPNPEAWLDTVTYIYTGKGQVSHGMSQNIMYLAGRVD